MFVDINYNGLNTLCGVFILHLLRKARGCCMHVFSSVNQVKRGGVNRVQNKSKSDKTQEVKKATEGKHEHKRNACGNCGLIHPKGQCLSYGKQCNKCQKMNHYARMCRSSKSVDSCRQEKSDEYLFLETVKVESVDRIRQSETEHVTLSLNNHDIRLKLDTGAEVNVIPYSTFKQVATTSKIKLRKPEACLSAYNGGNIPVEAVCTLQWQYKGTIHNLEFYITSIESEPVLSISACKKLGPIEFVTVIEHKEEGTEAFAKRVKTEYQDVFSGIGCLERPYHIELNSECNQL